MYKFILTFLLFCSTFAIAENNQSIAKQEEEIVEENFNELKGKAVVQVLNKITAKAKNLEIPVNSEMIFGTLKIEVKACWKSSPYELLENKILLNISEKKKGQDEYSNIFKGWMFSSSPAISSMEHSVYDVMAIDCLD